MERPPPERGRGLSLKTQEWRPAIAGPKFPEKSQAQAGLELWALPGAVLVLPAGMQGWLVGSWGPPGLWAGA